jgi:hypothetical protein
MIDIEAEKKRLTEYFAKGGKVGLSYRLEKGKSSTIRLG